jgi:hypothetical protein
MALFCVSLRCLVLVPSASVIAKNWCNNQQVVHGLRECEREKRMIALENQYYLAESVPSDHQKKWNPEQGPQGIH